jgi:uncharacterized protein (UPF0333 family)
VLLETGFMNNKEGLSLAYVLIVINIIVCAIGIYFYNTNIEGLSFINIYSILLLCLMGLQNIIMIYLQKDRRDPFVMILIIIMLCYFMSRIDTLMAATIFFDIYVPPYIYDDIKPSDFNYTLMFIMLSNAFIFLGLNSVRKRIEFKENNYIGKLYGKSWNVTIIIFLIFPIYFIGLPDLLTAFLLNMEAILIATFVYYLINRNNISKLNICISLLAIVLITIFRTMEGSRAGFLLLGTLFLPSYLSVSQSLKIRKKLILIVIPILLSVIMIYFYGTQFRNQARHISTSKGLSLEVYNMAMPRGDILFAQVPQEMLAILFIPPIERIGLLDASVDFITNSELYKNIFDIQYYYKSIIDNVLTPGFDIFDVDKVGKVTAYIRNGYGIPSKTFILSDMYQSDLLTVYGEYYALFGGFFALFFMSVSSYCFKKAYVMINTNNNFAFYFYRALILYFFYHWILSYGIDWQMIKNVAIALNAYLYIFIVAL